MSVALCNLGARITSIKLPIAGIPTELTVGYTQVNDYYHDSYYLGATCGRVCNRISNAEFQLNGKRYQLPKNDGNNCLHGGIDNFANILWEIDKKSLTQNKVTLTLTSCDGSQGFPGNLRVGVDIELTDNNKVIIQYHGVCDAPTPINLTNHTYFNLGESTCGSLLLTMNASNYLETNTSNTPTGKILPVEGTVFEFNNENCIGKKQQLLINNDKYQSQGFDHCMVIDTPKLCSPCAELISTTNGIKMSVFTDQPALQFYTGSYLSDQFIRYQGVCLEAQGFPDAINFNHFPSIVLEIGTSYQKRIVYQFDYLK